MEAEGASAPEKDSSRRTGQERLRLRCSTVGELVLLRWRFRFLHSTSPARRDTGSSLTSRVLEVPAQDASITAGRPKARCSLPSTFRRRPLEAI
jgi:hypothetical protein